jgi:hypothetical protein
MYGTIAYVASRHDMYVCRLHNCILTQTQRDKAHLHACFLTSLALSPLDINTQRFIFIPVLRVDTAVVTSTGRD